MPSHRCEVPQLATPTGEWKCPDCGQVWRVGAIWQQTTWFKAPGAGVVAPLAEPEPAPLRAQAE